MRSGAPEPLGLTLPFPPPIPIPHRTIDPHALKIPAAKRRNTRYPKTATLHFRLNQDTGWTRTMVVSPPKRILRTTANRAQVLFNNEIGKDRTRIMKLKGSARPSAKGGKPCSSAHKTRRVRWIKAYQRVLLEGGFPTQTAQGARAMRL